MLKVHNRLDPDLVKRIAEAAAAAEEEVLNNSVLDALLNTKPEDLIAPDSEAEVIKGNAYRSGCWLHSPALADLFAAADQRLTRVAKWAGINVKRVARVKARLIPGTKIVLLQPAPEEDLTAIPVNRYKGAITINLVTLLGEYGLTVEPGYRERYDIAYIPKESPHWPGLFIDLSAMKERRLSRPRKAQANPAPDEA